MSRANGTIMMERRDEDMTLFFLPSLITSTKGVYTECTRGNGRIRRSPLGTIGGRKDLLPRRRFFYSFLFFFVPSSLGPSLVACLFLFTIMAFVCLASTYHLFVTCSFLVSFITVYPPYLRFCIVFIL
jgi:hypothetical protein